MTPYIAKDFKNLLGTEGLSDTLLTNHFTLYEGYINNTNKLIELLDTKEIGTPEYSELQRRFGWEWNGMRLHELYFSNMKKGGSSLSEGSLKEKITEIYGSVGNWEKSFKGVGMMRGIGWVVLAYDKEQDELFSIWINEHDLGHLAGTEVILIMDVFEHAYMSDYGLKKADYIETFFKAIDWSVAEERFMSAKK